MNFFLIVYSPNGVLPSVKRTIFAPNIMGESHKHNVKTSHPQKSYILYGSLYMKFKNRQKQPW